MTWRKAGKFLGTFTSTTVFIAGALITLVGGVGLFLVGGLVVADWVEPIKWPERLTGTAPLQTLAVVVYVAVMIGACIGFWRAMDDE